MTSNETLAAIADSIWGVVIIIDVAWIAWTIYLIVSEVCA